MTRTWPEDWDDRIAGRGCPMCLQGRPDDTGHGVRFLEGRFSDAYLQRERLADRYTVVVWRGRHVVEPFELSDAEASQYWTEVLTAGKVLFRRYQPAKMNYQVLGNSVPHLHTHLVPRYLDDPAPERPLSMEATTDIVPEETLRHEVGELRKLARGMGSDS